MSIEWRSGVGDVSESGQISFAEYCQMIRSCRRWFTDRSGHRVPSHKPFIIRDPNQWGMVQIWLMHRISDVPDFFLVHIREDAVPNERINSLWPYMTKGTLSVAEFKIIDRDFCILNPYAQPVQPEDFGDMTGHLPRSSEPAILSSQHFPEFRPPPVRAAKERESSPRSARRDQSYPHPMRPASELSEGGRRENVVNTNRLSNRAQFLKFSIRSIRFLGGCMVDAGVWWSKVSWKGMTLGWRFSQKYPIVATGTAMGMAAGIGWEAVWWEMGDAFNEMALKGLCGLTSSGLLVGALTTALWKYRIKAKGSYGKGE